MNCREEQITIIQSNKQITQTNTKDLDKLKPQKSIAISILILGKELKGV